MSIRRESAHTPTDVERALNERGVPGKVEVRGPLAVLIVTPDIMAKLGDAEIRRTALAIAREHGFTHMAIELRSEGDATLPRG